MLILVSMDIFHRLQSRVVDNFNFPNMFGHPSDVKYHGKMMFSSYTAAPRLSSSFRSENLHKVKELENLKAIEINIAKSTNDCVQPQAFSSKKHIITSIFKDMRNRFLNVHQCSFSRSGYSPLKVSTYSENHTLQPNVLCASSKIPKHSSILPSEYPLSLRVPSLISERKKLDKFSYSISLQRCTHSDLTMTSKVEHTNLPSGVLVMCGPQAGMGIRTITRNVQSGKTNNCDPAMDRNVASKLCDVSYCDKTLDTKEELDTVKSQAGFRNAQNLIKSNKDTKKQVQHDSGQKPFQCNQKKKKAKPRPSKKRRIRLLVQRGLYTPNDSSVVQNQNSVSVKVIVGITNKSQLKSKAISAEDSDGPRSSTCSKLSFFVSGAELDSDESESSDFGDDSSDNDSFDDALWNAFNDRVGAPLCYENSVHLVYGISASNIDQEKDRVSQKAQETSLSQEIHAANAKWKEAYASPCYNDQEDSRPKAFNRNQVSFADDAVLVQITVLDDAGVERKGPWEEMARDRKRFKDRICKVEQQICHVFQASHRQYVYNKLYNSVYN